MQRAALPAPRLNWRYPWYEKIVAAHDAAVATGEAGYLDPSTGLSVFTTRYLLERGTCCDSGCRHCPYVVDP